nr:MAG TPA: hypothetical protein [Caudoviricetes sp.]
MTSGTVLSGPHLQISPENAVFTRVFGGFFYAWMFVPPLSMPPFWAVSGPPGHKKGRRPLPTPLISSYL